MAVFTAICLSGKRDSNPRPSAWEADALPLSYSRILIMSTKNNKFTNITFTISPPTLTTHHSPLTTHHSPLTTHHSPLTTHHSPLTTHHSPLTTHHSPLTSHIFLSSEPPMGLEPTTCSLRMSCSTD